jgi:heme-degrading monooxygenase HmoA
VHAVLIEVDVAGVDPEQGINALRERIVPAIKTLPGFQSGTWLTGGPGGRGLSLTVWDTEENAHGMAERFGSGSSPAASASVVRCEVREVATTA